MTLPAKQKIGFRLGEHGIHASVPDLQTLLDLFGTDDQHLATGLLTQAASAAGTEQGCEVITAIIEDISPKDATERLLAVQMAVTHTSLMAASMKMNGAESLEALEVFERSFNRLARTFTAQTEALRKHRTGGEQKVTVQHVNVSDGGQAIVGNVGGRG